MEDFRAMWVRSFTMCEFSPSSPLKSDTRLAENINVLRGRVQRLAARSKMAIPPWLQTWHVTPEVHHHREATTRQRRRGSRYPHS